METDKHIAAFPKYQLFNDFFVVFASRPRTKIVLFILLYARAWIMQTASMAYSGEKMLHDWHKFLESCEAKINPYSKEKILCDLTHFGLLKVKGRDAKKLLQGQLTY